MSNVLIMKSLSALPGLEKVALWDENIECIEVASMASVVDAVLKHEPGLVLLDGLGELGVRESEASICRIRNLDNIQMPSIAVMSSLDIAASDEERLMKMGANIVIPLPSPPGLWEYKLKRLATVPTRCDLRVPVNIKTWAKISGRDDILHGMALNVCTGGILLQVPELLPLDKKLDISFLVAQDQKPISAVAKVVWQNETELTCGIEFLALRDDSSKRLISFLRETFAISGSAIKGRMSSATVLSERVDWEAQLRTSEARKNVIMDAALDCIIAIDQENRILEFNDTAEKTFGYHKQDILLQKGLNKLLPEPLCKSFRQQLYNFVSTGNEKQDIVKTLALHADGSEFPVELRAQSTYVEEDAVLILYVKDVTEREKLMQEQKRSAQLAALGTVAAGVAHEINNPIQGILNLATIIQNKPEDRDRIVDVSQRIINESLRIANLTKDLLFYSKENKNNKEVSDIQEIVKSILSLVEPKIRRNTVSIDLTFSENLPAIAINPQAVQQAVINLIDNSCDALSLKDVPAEEKVVQVCVNLKETNLGSFICIEVSDKGIGMPQEVLTKAKDAFFSTKPSSQGTGLGLSIVNEIVSTHDGQLEIESKNEEYTKVRILLPIQ